MPQLAPTTRRELDALARSWAAVGCLGSEAVVRDFGGPGCRRPCVIVTYHHYAETLWIAEENTRREAELLARHVNRRLDRVYTAARAEIEAAR